MAVKFPKTIGACADALYALRQERAALQATMKTLEDKEAALCEHIIETLPKSEASGVAGKVARVAVVVKVVPTVTDWDVLYKYIGKTKSWDLLQRRVSAAAVSERWDDAKDVPGVGRFNAVTVTVNKL